VREQLLVQPVRGEKLPRTARILAGDQIDFFQYL